VTRGADSSAEDEEEGLQVIDWILSPEGAGTADGGAYAGNTAGPVELPPSESD